MASPGVQVAIVSSHEREGGGGESFEMSPRSHEMA